MIVSHVVDLRPRKRYALLGDSAAVASTRDHFPSSSRPICGQPSSADVNRLPLVPQIESKVMVFVQDGVSVAPRWSRPNRVRLGDLAKRRKLFAEKAIKAKRREVFPLGVPRQLVGPMDSYPKVKVPRLGLEPKTR